MAMTIAKAMESGTITGQCLNRDCKENGKNHPLNRRTLLDLYADSPWGPETDIEVICDACGYQNVLVSVEFSGTPHDSFSDGAIVVLT